MPERIGLPLRYDITMLYSTLHPLEAATMQWHLDIGDFKHAGKYHLMESAGYLADATVFCGRKKIGHWQVTDDAIPFEKLKLNRDVICKRCYHIAQLNEMRLRVY